MAYDPRNRNDRRELATAIVDALNKAEFIEEYVEDKGVKERVFFRAVGEGDKFRICVYTGVVGEGDLAECRKAGTDAIRVCVLYRSRRDDKEKGVVKTTRVHRTGEITAVIERMLGRMREAWVKGRDGNICTCTSCGSPTFVSKAGNNVCAEICWKSDDELRVQAPRNNYRRRSSYSRSRRGYRY
jgi:hypothetical protein